MMKHFSGLILALIISYNCAVHAMEIWSDGINREGQYTGGVIKAASDNIFGELQAAPNAAYFPPQNTDESLPDEDKSEFSLAIANRSQSLISRGLDYELLSNIVQDTTAPVEKLNNYLAFITGGTSKETTKETTALSYEHVKELQNLVHRLPYNDIVRNEACFETLKLAALSYANRDAYEQSPIAQVIRDIWYCHEGETHIIDKISNLQTLINQHYDKNAEELYKTNKFLLGTTAITLSTQKATLETTKTQKQNTIDLKQKEINKLIERSKQLMIEVSQDNKGKQELEQQAQLNVLLTLANNYHIQQNKETIRQLCHQANEDSKQVEAQRDATLTTISRIKKDIEQQMLYTKTVNDSAKIHELQKQQEQAQKQLEIISKDLATKKQIHEALREKYQKADTAGTVVGDMKRSGYFSNLW